MVIKSLISIKHNNRLISQAYKLNDKFESLLEKATCDPNPVSTLKHKIKVT